jgi:transcriptional regulator with XRE-family HTH domain
MSTLVGNKIKALRINKHLSQEQVAEHLHISQSTYARIESGETNSWANYIEPLSKLFEIQPEELLKNETINISHNKGNSTNAYIINQLSEKLIEQLEKRIDEKDKYIKQLEKLLNK